MLLKNFVRDLSSTLHKLGVGLWGLHSSRIIVGGFGVDLRWGGETYLVV